VVLRELVDLYEPVPFEHRVHAEMTEMWDGCVTCHHRSPAPATQPTTGPSGPADAHAASLEPLTQDAAAQIPACKSCHPVAEHDAAVQIDMPSLKGALHRQCLNCHREWSGANDCVVCHRPLDKQGEPVVAATAPAPPASDIVGRMHPPIPEPDEKTYVARFTPAVGRNVLFRHREHSTAFGLKCVNCHHRDSCANCHSPGAQPGEHVTPVLDPARSWSESHGPCMSCHSENRCDHCHYADGATPPPPFEHARTGQALDADHGPLACADCHAAMDLVAEPTCGGTECHASELAISFPIKRPGEVAATQPATLPATMPATGPATRDAVPKAVIRRVRR
jgi:hypothetical protein